MNFYYWELAELMQVVFNHDDIDEVDTLTDGEGFIYDIARQMGIDEKDIDNDNFKLPDMTALKALDHYLKWDSLIGYDYKLFMVVGALVIKALHKKGYKLIPPEEETR